MPVGTAAAQLGTTPRMLRYRESLGLVRPSRTPAGYRGYAESDLRAASLSAELEAAWDVTPAALAFGLRTLREPEVAARMRQLDRLAGGLASPALAALEFDERKARHLLGLAS
jgi:MerR family copper efflux transcriptional regulator